MLYSKFNTTYLTINSPLEQFEVTNLLGFNAPIFGYFHLNLTNLSLYSILVLFIILSIHYLGNNGKKLVPSNWSIALESLYASVNSMVRVQLGKEFYFPFIYSLFTLNLVPIFVGLYFFVATGPVINQWFEFFNLNTSDLINCVAESISNSTSGTNQHNSSTNTTLIQDDGSWSNAIRSLFIFGTGISRLVHLHPNGSPGKRFAIVTATLAGDAATRIINNTVNDPNYIKNHFRSWKAIWESDGVAKVDISNDNETVAQISQTIGNEFSHKGQNFTDLLISLQNSLFEQFYLLLEPVNVQYSTELLANQIYDLSIMLFILSSIILFLIVILLFNIFMYINMDKIIQYFNNKYIKWYLVFNKKLIGIEIFVLGGTILYFMYTLINGIKFIATHPIVIS